MGSIVTKLFGWLFLLAFGLGAAAGGLVGCYLIVADAAEDLRVFWGWADARCEITKSEVVALNPRYRFEVEYRYSHDGRDYAGSAQRRKNVFGAADFEIHENALQVARRYPVGGSVPCYIDPSDPARALLERSKPWQLLLLPFPAFFLLIGLALLLSPLYSAKSPEEAGKRGGPLSQRARPGLSSTARRIGYAVLASVGLACMLFAYLLAESEYLAPLRLVTASQHWREASCTIISGSVLEIRGDENDTYKPDIFYRFENEGRELRSNRYNFVDNALDGTRATAESVVRLHPPGSSVLCYYDPLQPGDVVIDRLREPGPASAIASVILLLVGLILVALGVRRALRAPR